MILLAGYKVHSKNSTLGPIVSKELNLLVSDGIGHWIMVECACTMQNPR